MRYFTHMSKWLWAMAAFVVITGAAHRASWAGGGQGIIPISPIHAPMESRPIYWVDPTELIKGKIERIDVHGVEIDSRHWRFSTSVAFLSGSGRLIDASKFKRGTAAGIRMDEKDEITAIWNLDPEYAGRL